MHYSKGDVPEVEGLIGSTWPDVIAIQEWIGSRDSRIKSDPAWHVHAGENLYLASRHPIRRVVHLGERQRPTGWLRRPDMNSSHPTAQFTFSIFTRPAVATGSPRRCASSQGFEVASNSAQRRQQLDFIARHARDCEGPVIVLGDFNTPPESPIIGEAWRDYTDAFDVASWGFRVRS